MSNKYHLQTVALVVLIVVLLCSVFAVFWLERRSTLNSMVQFSAQQNAVVLSQALRSVRSVYTGVVDHLIDQGLSANSDYQSQPHSLPLPVTFTMAISEDFAQRDNGVATLLYSPWPYPNRVDTGGLRDDFQREAWKYLTANPASEFKRVETNVDGSLVFRYALADTLSPACVDCHNNHPDSPKRDWRAGQVRGVLEVSQQLGNWQRQTYYEMNLKSLLDRRPGLGVSLLCLILLSIVLLMLLYQKRLSAHHRLELALHCYHRELELRCDELDQFAWRTSHDIRSPLNTIHALAVFVGEDLNNQNIAQAQTLVDKIITQSDGLRSLLSGILALSRADADGGKLSWIDLPALLDEVIGSLEDSQQARDVQIKSPVCKVGSVWSQSVRIRQVIQNLLENAIKYSDANKECRWVSVVIESVADDLLIKVSDNGLGIPVDFHDQVFVKFKQYDATQGHEIDQQSLTGSGLGLSLVARHVDVLGGEISFKSDSSGTVFSILLPRIERSSMECL